MEKEQTMREAFVHQIKTMTNGDNGQTEIKNLINVANQLAEYNKAMAMMLQEKNNDIARLKALCLKQEAEIVTYRDACIAQEKELDEYKKQNVDKKECPEVNPNAE